MKSDKAVNSNLDKLFELYRIVGDDQLALFLGAGVNGGPWAVDHPACASWPALLNVLSETFQRRDILESMLESAGDDWIRVATTVLRDIDRDAIVNAIDRSIYKDVFSNPSSRMRRPTKHKVIEWRVLKGMPTLRATVCFSAAINDPTKKRSGRRNPKISRVLTTNYDFFFGAAWPRYTSMKQSWWAETWASAGTRLKGAGPVVYLHGYLPYSGAGEKDVVVTQEDYTDAYFGPGGKSPRFAWNKLMDAVRQCHLIFIGFSFSDERVANCLQDGGKEHFAFLLKDDVHAIQAAEDVGVIPVTLESWTQLPDTLGRVYSAGLGRRELGRTGLTRGEYWAALQRGLEPRI